MAKAIVTMAAGERCHRPWKQLLYPGWRHWCDRHGYELVVFDSLLDVSTPAQQRSATWQKLLVMGHPELQRFSQVLWLDADVFVNAHAPDPFLHHDPQRVAMAMDDGSPLSAQPHWFCEAWSSVLLHSLGLHAPAELVPFSYFDLWGLNARRRPLFNNGVVAFSPLYHSELFLSIYHHWPDGGPGALDEMIPMNLELSQRNLLQPLDGRFNRLFGVYHAVWRQDPLRVQQMMALPTNPMTLIEFSVAMIQSSYFLHFAGAHGLMEHILSQFPITDRPA